MGRYGFTVTRLCAAPCEDVWALVSDASSWKEWAGIVSSSLEREGDPAPDGVGAIRRFGPAPFTSREQVVEWDAPRHLGYVVLSGMPVRSYRADIRLSPVGGDSSQGVRGTSIEWTATFDPKIPGTGPALQAVLKSLLGRFATRAGRRAEANFERASGIRKT
jgi:uncharacterized protein YndB with AHSA1/START domain